MTLWINGISLHSPPPLGMMWLPDYRVAGKRRNQKAINELVTSMSSWKAGNRELLAIVNESWGPIVSSGVLPRIAPRRLAHPELTAIRGMEGSVLATARRHSPSTPSDPLSNAVAAMHYAAIERSTDDPLTNIMASWLFAVGYWAYHLREPAVGVEIALQILDRDLTHDPLGEMVTETRYQPASNSQAEQATNVIAARPNMASRIPPKRRR